MSAVAPSAAGPRPVAAAVAGPSTPPASAGPSAWERSAGLDGLRGLAALLVFGFHIYLYGRPGPLTSRWEAIPMRFSVGLIAFFVLSGFLLYRGFERAAARQVGPVDTRRYLIRRVARILPAYWVCLAVIFLLLGGQDDVRGVKMPEPDQLWLFAVMAQNYTATTLLEFNPVTWTLVVELAFYALLPLLGAFAFYKAQGRRRPQVLMAAALIVIGVGWQLLVDVADLPNTFDKALPGYLQYFALGILAALTAGWMAETGRRIVSAPATAGLVLAGLGLVFVDGLWHTAGGGELLSAADNLISGIGFALITFAVAQGAGGWASWAASRPIASLGLISYGIYLWHVPVILYVQHVGMAGRDYLALSFFAVSLTLALATLSWLLVEKPLIAWAHRRPSQAPAPRPAYP